MRTGRTGCSVKQRRFIHAIREDRLGRSARTIARQHRISAIGLDEWCKSRMFRTTLSVALRSISRSRRLAIETELIRFALRVPYHEAFDVGYGCEPRPVRASGLNLSLQYGRPGYESDEHDDDNNRGE